MATVGIKGLVCIVSGFLDHNVSVPLLGGVWWRWTWTVTAAVCCVHGHSWTTSRQRSSGQRGVTLHLFTVSFIVVIVNRWHGWYCEHYSTL